MIVFVEERAGEMERFGVHNLGNTTRGAKAKVKHANKLWRTRTKYAEQTTE